MPPLPAKKCERNMTSPGDRVLWITMGTTGVAVYRTPAWRPGSLTENSRAVIIKSPTEVPMRS